MFGDWRRIPIDTTSTDPMIPLYAELRRIRETIETVTEEWIRLLRKEDDIAMRFRTMGTFLNCGLLTVSEAGDLLCQQLVPQFPTQSGSNLLGDLGRS
jgi:hypothetical protein